MLSEITRNTPIHELNDRIEDGTIPTKDIHTLEKIFRRKRNIRKTVEKDAKHYRLKQMSRIIRLAFMIKNHPGICTRQGLANHFKVDKATIQRDINLLRIMGMEITVEGKQGYKLVSGFDFMDDKGEEYP